VVAAVLRRGARFAVYLLVFLTVAAAAVVALSFAEDVLRGR